MTLRRFLIEGPMQMHWSNLQSSIELTLMLTFGTCFWSAMYARGDHTIPLWMLAICLGATPFFVIMILIEVLLVTREIRASHITKHFK